MPDPTDATVTFLLTDIEGSTRLWETAPEAMQTALERHEALAREILRAHRGELIKSRGEGDSLFAVFTHPADAVQAAALLQCAFQAEPWPDEVPLPVRMAVHTGAATLRDGDYYGGAVNRCARLRALAHGGQVLVSGVTRDLAADRLPHPVGFQDLGAHRLRDLAGTERVYQLLHPALRREFPPLRSGTGALHNLPQPLTSFVGREAETAAVTGLLGAARLLTLVGSGGTGKTRLSLEAAGRLVEEYEDGVWLVELAAVSEAERVPQAIAAVLGLKEEQGRPITDTILRYLRERKTLLLVDNCEHLLDPAARLVGAILRECPGVRILASSREGLGVPGEQTFRVPSLGVPEPHTPVTPAALQRCEAVQLFLERARLHLPDFDLTPTNAAAVAQICVRLDGIPLALELAAARIRALPPEKLLERLDDRFRLLTGGSRTLLPRQQTLRALIDWSHDLLEAGERVLFRRLAAFAGGWTLEQAEQVGSGEPLEEWEVLDLLTSLVEKSLVLYDADRGRYRLLETVRQYARDRLLESGEGEAVRTRHRDCFLSLATQARDSLRGPEQAEWLERLEWEHENLRAAFTWTLATARSEAPDEQVGLRFGHTLLRFWHLRGHLTEGRQRLAEALATYPEPTAARAWAQDAAGYLACVQSDFRASQALHEEALRWFEAHGERRGVACASENLGHIATAAGDYPLGRGLYTRALEAFREIGSPEGVTSALGNLGHVAFQAGDMEEAERRFTESLAAAQALGNRRTAALQLGNLAAVAAERGDGPRATELASQSLAIYRELGDRWGTGQTLRTLAEVETQCGNPQRARELAQECVAISRELGDRGGYAAALEVLAGALRRLGEAESAEALEREASEIRATLF